ncbi:amino acid adenylation domain-containing protein [Nonomuraea endophytica]|uniref:amino acid adenylation domain-containing protein n=1 Tax=Nonomuraea endophytica TaxID=714136 RepID=UPI0037C7359B
MSLADLILSRAARRPGAVAVRQWADVLTYGELAVRAERLAVRLRAHGVGPETLVGVCLRRRPSMIVAILGVLRAGGAYVPLDPDGPPVRREEILADAGITTVIVDDDTAAGFSGVRRVRADDGDDGPCPPPGAGPGNAAYVLYTSGSTGRPKGVVVEQHSVAAFADGFARHTGAGPDTRALGFAALTFDLSVLDIFVTLATGGALQLAGDADRADPARLQRFVAEHRIDWGWIPVVLLTLLEPAGLPEWRTVITGGEAPGPEQVERWTSTGKRFLNCYGPTEATVWATSFEAHGRWERSLPIGAPLPGYTAAVYDETVGAVPDGGTGELLLGGTGVARGYLGRPGLTADRFVPDPSGHGTRLYRTGDLARRDEEGLHFLGRSDRQVKIRGQRVEIGEVETVLRAHPSVEHAVVEAVDGPSGPRLVAFCSPDSDASDLLAHCAERLPAAMVPAQLVRLPALPLTPSGKVNGLALRTLAENGRTPGGAVAATPLERGLADLWAQVLGYRDAAMEDDFFAMGGDSVAAMRLVAAVGSTLELAVAVEDVFAGRTLGGFAARAAAAGPRAERLPTGNPPALSPAQRRLWFVDKLAPGATAYNLALAERLHGPLDVTALGDALATVIARHEVLRWRVPDTAGVPYVEVDPPPRTSAEGAVRLVVEDVSEERLEAVLAEESGHRFELAAGPLWRARLLRLKAQEHVLALTFHHAVFDGWSQRPFLEDLGRAYAGEELPSPPAQFADYVAWRDRQEREHGQDHLNWWKAHLDGAPVVLDLPRDRPRPPVQTYAGGRTSLTLGTNTSDALRTLAVELGTTPPTAMLAAFAEVVRRVTGRDDILVGTPSADRRHEAFHDLVGFFLEVVPLRLRAGADDSFADRVRAAAGEFLSALGHHAVALDRIVDAVAVPRDPGRAPLVQVLFNVYNFPEPRLPLPGVRSERAVPGVAGSPFDLTIYAVERDGAYAIDCVYNADLYTAERVERLLSAYGALLAAAAADPHAPINTHELPDAAALTEGVRELPGKAPGDNRAGATATTDPTRTTPTADPTQATPTADLVRASATADPARAAPMADSARPVTVTERLVARVWREVLDREDEVGATANFFDAGGNSLAMVRVRARLAALLGRELTIVDLFKHTTVRGLAAFLDGESGTPELNRADRRAQARRSRQEKRRRI